MEDSIEEDIKILENFTEQTVLYGGTVGMTLEKYKDLQLSIKHILSDYKRVLKENEELNIRLQEEINEKCKLKTELYLNSIPKTVIQDKIEEIINNPTYGYVGCEWNDIEVVQLLENILEGEEKNVNYKNSNNSIMDISRNNYIN